MALTENERLTRSVNTLTDALEELTERNKRLESYLLTLAPDIEYQERRIERGYDVEDRIRARVAGYRELFEREGTE